MLVSVRPIVLGLTVAVLVFTAPSRAEAQQTAPATPPAGSPQGQTSQQPNSDYGSGGHAVIQKETAGDELVGIVDATPRGQAANPETSENELVGTVVFDPSGAVRRKETNTFTQIGSAEQKVEMRVILLNSKGQPAAYSDLKYDLRGGLSYSDITHYGLHGERTAEEVTNYKSDGYEIKDWSLGTHGWYSNNIPYKTPLPAGTPAQTPLTPTNTNIGVLFPRSYLPGEIISGSLWPSAYAENFKSVPGLSEYSFPIQLYHLPDGSPEWSSLEIGVKGDGYIPVNPNGTFSLHIPYDWKGPLELQARQPDPVAGIGPSNAVLNIDPPAAAPTLTNDQFPAAAHSRLLNDTENHLVNLWEDACDDEEILDRLYDEPTPDWPRIDAIEDELDDIYDDIDDIEDDMPPQDVISLAQQMVQEAASFHDWLSKQPNLTADDQADLKDSSSWTDFLDDEIGYNKFLAGWEPVQPLMQPYWTNPVLTQGKLGEIGGSFSLDPSNTFLHIDKFPITPLAATPNNWYFMPPSGLTAGLHYSIIDSPLYSETIFPIFSMTLTMSADNLNLLKGQSTMYHVILDGLNGLPAGAWGSSSDPADLVGSAELSAAQKGVGTSRTGYITLSVSNGSPGVIAMQDQFKWLSAASFVPNGSSRLDGGVTALVKGSFTINGVARAYLDPEIGVGAPPGTAPSGGSTGSQPGTTGTNWIPPFSLNYDPAAFSNSSFMTSCPGSNAVPPANTPAPMGGKPATPCVDSVINDLMPARSVPDDTQVKGAAPSTVPIGDNTNTLDVDAARKRREKAISTEADANHELLVAETNEYEAFQGALKNLSVDDQNDYATASKRFTETLAKKMKLDTVENPTAEDVRQAQLLKEQLAIDKDLLRVAKEDAVEKFKPEDRQAWQAAHDALEKAQSDFNDAKNERRAADEAWQKLQAATAN